ncbi:MAG: hypothetical protein COA79_09450 [Planctomycetota bacterium]|nr:MAG: hypothetical protein COA79_09450 [Planctomycetota bacterium]
MKDLHRVIGFTNVKENEISQEQLYRYVNLKLAASGLPLYENKNDKQFFDSAGDLLRKSRVRSQLLKDYLCPVDRRIQNFINDHLSDVIKINSVQIPTQTIDLDRHGLARAMSLSPDSDHYITDQASSYKIKQGVLHNPINDRRTTKGVFHIAEGGLPIPSDKKAVPKGVFAHILADALKPTKTLLRIPFTATQKKKAESFVSLMVRPVVCPEIPGVFQKKTMEIRLFAPGSLVSNLDFVESIFGNAGDPHLPENDAGLDIEHFSGHSGLVILAPHIKQLKKKDLGLPHHKDATKRQIKEGMCWKKEDELYNEGKPFKICCRNEEGVIITILADNYFGYCKKEVKTQIGYAANLLGLSEEEHAGGAVAFASRRLPDIFKEINFKLYIKNPKLIYRFSDVKKRYKNLINFKKDGHGQDKAYPHIHYVPEDAEFNLAEQKVSWTFNKKPAQIKLLPQNVYIYPSGFKVRMDQHPTGAYWRLIGIRAEGTLIHKPCTVSGGGKSEISKPIDYSMIYKSFFIKDLKKDLDAANKIIEKEYTNRFKKKLKGKKKDSRPLLSRNRSLGSVIKLLTPSEIYTNDYNKWLETIPNHIRSLIFIIKHHEEFLGTDWRDHFSVDKLDGLNGNELKFKRVRHLVSSYLRVGMEASKDWRIFQIRPDYIPAEKIQYEDDITSSIVVPSKSLKNCGDNVKDNVKIVENCEYRFFQRPDDAIVRGFDIQAENDLSGKNTFVSNFAPLTGKDARKIRDSVVDFVQFTPPMKKIIEEATSLEDDQYFICSAFPRIVNGQHTKNVRYLQTRQDIVTPVKKYIAEMGLRLQRNVPENEKPDIAVESVLPGRRLNPSEPDGSVRNLAVFNPIHFQELPELFMEFICSLTGKSPSTTGAGSEGALTKGPFNALMPTIDLNNALVSYILTEYDGYTTAANYVGKLHVAHDISVLIPELWCRMTKEEKDHQYLIDNDCMDKIEDFKYKGKKVLASRLGHRINENFALRFLGRIFNNPLAVFNKDILRPETQDMAEYVDGINNIVENQKRIATLYIEDGSASHACPPLRALLHIMAYGEFKGMTEHSKQFRELFTKKNLLASDWYQERLLIKQQRDIKLWARHCQYIEDYIDNSHEHSIISIHTLKELLSKASKERKRVQSMAYLKSLIGTIGADPIT